MKSKRFSRLLNILIKVLTIIILASLFGVKYIGLFSTKANAEDGWFSFNNLFDNNPIFNLVGAQGQQNWLDLELDLDAEQVGDDVTLTATINTSLPTGTNKKYYWYYSNDGGTNFYNCIGGGDRYTTTNTYQAAYSPGNIYKVVVYAEVQNSYSLIWDAYDRFFSRSVDQAGLDTWGTTLTQHTLINKFADLTGVTPVNEISALSFAMVISKEYLSNTTWNIDSAKELIAKLYRFALGREGSQNEINSWYNTAYKQEAGSTNVPIDVYYTVPNGVFRVINGICGSSEAGNKHEERYYYDKSTGKYTYAMATLTDVTTYVNEDTVSPSTLNINPNGGTMDVHSPRGTEGQNISSTTSFRQYADSQLEITNISKADTYTTAQLTISYDGNTGTIESIDSTNTDSIQTTTHSYVHSGWTKSPSTLNGEISNNIYTFPSTNGLTDTITATWQQYNSKESTEVTLPNATKLGYTLKGWYTAKTGGVRRGVAGETYKPGQSETLYAHWQINESILRIEPNGGSIDVTVPVDDTELTVTYSRDISKEFGTTAIIHNIRKDPLVTNVTCTMSYYGNKGVVASLVDKNIYSYRVDTRTYAFSHWTKTPDPLLSPLVEGNNEYTYVYPPDKNHRDTLRANYTETLTQRTTNFNNTSKCNKNWIYIKWMVFGNNWRNKKR